jgi:hypothetical protein
MVTKREAQSVSSTVQRLTAVRAVGRACYQVVLGVLGRKVAQRVGELDSWRSENCRFLDSDV